MGKPTYTNTGVTVGHLASFNDKFGNIQDSGLAVSALTGGGTVTSVSASGTQGVTTSVANPTTSPAITIGLGAITPTSVNASGAVVGSNLSGTNTGDSTAPAQVLTGYSASSGTVTSADTILTALEKTAGNISAVTGAMVYQGTWNATTNTPTLTSSVGTKGYYYTVSTAGTTSLNGIASWNIGDIATFNGTSWQKIDGVTNEVISVAGRTGAVTLSFTDLSGTASNAQIPAPTTSALGGIEAASGATSNSFVTYVDTSGVQHVAQPAFSNISGQLSNAQLPAAIAIAAVALSVVSSAIATNAELGNYFNVTLVASTATTMSPPSNPADGQVITYELLQPSGGSGTVTWASGASGFDFGTSGSPTLTTTAGDYDLVGFRYSSRKGQWLYLGSQLGF